MMSTFVIVMDNYFTFPQVQKTELEPERIKNVNKEDALFNDFYWTVDEYGSLVGRWMDNGM
eukprot:9107737-Ditylum_brightwellii.AAC.1